MDQINGLLDTFRDAKEYGSILYVENYNWDLLRRFVNAVNVEGQMTLDAVGLTETEERLLVLIEIGETMARKYKVVVTNPPYMGIANGSILLQKLIKKDYFENRFDLFSVFMDKCNRMIQENGFQAMITMHAWMFQASYEKIRAMINIQNIVSLLHLGARAFDEISGEVVQTACFVIRKNIQTRHIGIFYRLVDFSGEENKKQAFLNDIGRYVRIQDEFKKIPGNVIAYWTGNSFINIFNKNEQLADISFPKQGIHTGDNNLFLRLWYEVDVHTICLEETEEWIENYKWAKLNKGGIVRKWYGNKDYIILWKDNGSAIKNGRSVGANNGTFFSELIGFTDITTNMPSFRYYGKGFIYDVSGPSLIFNNSNYSVYYFLALLNSIVTKEAMKILSPTMHMNQTALSKITIGDEYIAYVDKVELLAKDCVQYAMKDWDSFETSWDFKRHPLLPPIGKITADEEIGEKEIPLRNEIAPQERDPSVTVLSKDYTKEETAFAIFCIENVAQYLGVDSAAVYTAFAKNSDILDGYIIPCYDALHTQGKDYIVNDLVELMQEKGVAL